MVSRYVDTGFIELQAQPAIGDTSEDIESLMQRAFERLTLRL